MIDLKNIKDKTKLKDISIAFYRAGRENLQFPFNFIVAPYHYILSTILGLACYYEILPFPWYLGLTPTFLAIIINIFIMASMVSMVRFAHEQAIKKGDGKS